MPGSDIPTSEVRLAKRRGGDLPGRIRRPDVAMRCQRCSTPAWNSGPDMIQTTHDVIRGSTAAVRHGHRPCERAADRTGRGADDESSDDAAGIGLTHAGLRDRLACAWRLPTLGR